MRIQIETPKNSDRCISVSGLISKATLDLFVFLYFIDISITHRPGDWMVYKGRVKYSLGTYRVYEKNDRYKHLEVTPFIWRMKEKV